MSVRYTQAGTSLSFANLLYAQSAGYFEDEGLDMEYKPFPPSSGDMVTLLLTDEADVGAGAPSATYSAIQQGRDLKNYAVTESAPSQGLTLSNETISALAAKGITPDSPIDQRITALRGLKLASTGVGSAQYALLSSMLASAGLKVDGDVTVLGVPDHATAANSTRQGQTDGYVAPAPEVLLGNTGGWGQVWLTLKEAPTLAKTPWIELTSSPDWVKAHPEAMKAIMTAIWKANKDFQDKPDEVRQSLKDNWFKDTDEELFSAAFELVRPTFTGSLVPSPSGMAPAIDLFNSTAREKFEPSFEDVYDPTYAQETNPA